MSGLDRYGDMQLMIQDMLTATLGTCYMNDVRMEFKQSANRYDLSMPSHTYAMTLKIDFESNRGIIAAIDNWRSAKEEIKPSEIMPETVEPPVVKRIVGDEGSW